MISDLSEATSNSPSSPILQSNAELAFNRIYQMPGLKPIKPLGAMYMMVEIELHNFPEFNSDLQFVERLISEQSVMCLPGKCFDVDNFVRIVLTVPKAILMDALNRMHQFCTKHYVNTRKQVLQSIYENENRADEIVSSYKYLKDLKNRPSRKLSEPKDHLINNMINMVEMDC